MYIHDSHVHSDFSFDVLKDGSCTMEKDVEAAIAKGVNELTICDHCDIDDILDGLYAPYDADNVKKEIYRLKEKYKGKIQLNYGIELGQPHARKAEAEKLISDYGFEFVLGSLHNMRNYPDFYFLRYAEMTPAMIDYLVRRNFSELRELVDFGKISSLAHITYIKRYMTNDGVNLDYKPYYDEFESLFKKMIANKVPMEINTSGLRKGSTTLPEPEISALYREVGGELITLGSDAHFPKDIGEGIPETAAFLRELGFKSQCVIREGKTVQIEL